MMRDLEQWNGSIHLGVKPAGFNMVCLALFFQCTAMLYSMDSRFNGLWFYSPCGSVADSTEDSANAFYICQLERTWNASSGEATINGNNDFVETSGLPSVVELTRSLEDLPVECPDGYFPGFYNATALKSKMTTTVQPVRCLQLVSQPGKMTWEVSWPSFLQSSQDRNLPDNFRPWLQRLANYVSVVGRGPLDFNRIGLAMTLSFSTSQTLGLTSSWLKCFRQCSSPFSKACEPGLGGCE